MKFIGLIIAIAVAMTIKTATPLGDTIAQRYVNGQAVDVLATDGKEYQEIADKYKNNGFKVYLIGYAIMSKMKYDDKHSEEITREGETRSAIEALRKGKGICTHFAMAYGKVLDKAGIQNKVIIGKVEGNGHAWNLVNIDGKWQLLDLVRGGKNFIVSDVEIYKEEMEISNFDGK